MGIYNICGFTVSVTGEVEHFFNREFGFFSVTDHHCAPELRIIPVSDQQGLLPIRPKGMKIGIDILVDEMGFMLRYNKGVPGQFIIQWAEMLFAWSDKTLVHAGSVASASFSYLLCAGPNVGKTTSVLQLVSRGMGYFSDDWALVSQEGQMMPFPKTIRVFDYNLAHSREMCRKIMGSDRFWSPFMRARLRLRNDYVDLLPHRLLRFAFDRWLGGPITSCNVEEFYPGSLVTEPKPIHTVFWLRRHNDGEFAASDITPYEMARRCLRMIMVERSYFFDWYNTQSAIGFPITYYEAFQQRVLHVLEQAFTAKRCIELLIPLGATPRVLADSLAGFML